MDKTRFDIGLVSPEETLAVRMSELTEEFGYHLKRFTSFEELLDTTDELRLVVAFIKDDKNPNLAAELAQAARHASSNCFVICGVSRSLPKEAAVFARKSGADLIMLEEELYQSSKLEYVITQVLHASHVPIKASDLSTTVALPFDIYHLMPQRKKFLRFLFSGDTPDSAKIKKITEVGEIYIKQTDVEIYKKYISDTQDRSSAGLAKRCRAQFLALSASFSNMVFMLTDQTESASFGEGEKLLGRCRDLCSELLGTLGEFGNAWEIINNSVYGEFGSVERAPAVAAYAALFALQMGSQQIDQIMLAALLADLALVLLPPSVTKKLRNNRVNDIDATEFVSYSKYPQTSLDLLLNKKLPIDTKTRNVLLSVQERSDGKGFPRKLESRKIPEEAQLIHLSREFDRRTVVRMGEARVDPKVVLEALVREDFGTFSRFTPMFLGKFKNCLLKS